MSKPLTLQEQLLMRVAKFQENFPEITQAEIARYCNIGESNFGAALAGRRGLSANSCLKLHTLLSLPRNEVIKKFSQPVRSSRILNLQQSVQGQPARGMHLDNSGWYPSTDGSGGVDPYDPTGNAIDNTPDADTTAPAPWDQSLIDTLRTARGIHRKIVRTINQFINQAKVNAGITTPSGVAQKFSRRS